MDPKDIKIKELEKKVAYLTRKWEQFETSDKYIFNKDIYLAEGRSFADPFILGGSASSVVGFYGTSGTAQQASITSPSIGSFVGSDTVSIASLTTNLNNLKTAVDDLRTRLATIGITA